MKRLKKALILGLTCLTCAAAFAVTQISGITAAFADESSEEPAAVTAENANIQMKSGASVRLASDLTADEAYKESGIRFALTLAVDEYEALAQATQNGTYQSVRYGICIAPADYPAFNVANVFGVGGDKLYDWATYNDNGELVYTPETDENGANKYARIVNLSTDTMMKITSETAESYVFYASLTGIKVDNLDRQFRGLGYISYTVTDEDGALVTSYRFAENNDNVRSITQVAQKAVYVAEDDNSAWLTEKYVTPVEEKTREYSIEHYADGALFDTTTANTTVNATNVSVGTDDITNSETVAGEANGDVTVTTTYTYDASNENNVSVIDRVYADEEYTLRKYYNKTVKAEIDTAKATRQYNIVKDNAKGTYKATLYYANATTADTWQYEIRIYADNTANKTPKWVDCYYIKKAVADSVTTVTLGWRSAKTSKAYTDDTANKILELLSEGKLNALIAIDRSLSGTALTETFAVSVDVNGNGSYVDTLKITYSDTVAEGASESDKYYYLGIQKNGEFSGKCSITYQRVNEVVTGLYASSSGSNSDIVTGFTDGASAENKEGVYVFKIKYTYTDSWKNSDEGVLELRTYTNVSGTSKQGFKIIGGLYYNKDSGFSYETSRGTNNYSGGQLGHKFGTDKTDGVFNRLAKGTYTVAVINNGGVLTIWADDGTGTLVNVGTISVTAFNAYTFGINQNGTKKITSFSSNACGWEAYYYAEATSLSVCPALADVTVSA